MYKYIYYKGEDLVNINKASQWYGKTSLKSGKIYKLDSTVELNDYCIFYIFDDLGGGSRGYELKITEVETLREYNLKKLLED